MRFEVVSRLSTEKKWFCFGKKKVEKKRKKKKFQKRIFVVRPSHSFYGEHRDNDAKQRER